MVSEAVPDAHVKRTCQVDNQIRGCFQRVLMKTLASPLFKKDVFASPGTRTSKIVRSRGPDMPIRGDGIEKYAVR